MKITSSESDQQELRVLVVDDQRVSRFATGALLERKGCKVEYAEDGKTALEILRENRGAFDAVFSDNVFPCFPLGWEVAKNVFEELLVPFFAILTASGEYVEQRFEQEDIVGIPVLEKPLSSEKVSTLVTSLRKLLLESASQLSEHTDLLYPQGVAVRSAVRPDVRPDTADDLAADKLLVPSILKS